GYLGDKKEARSIEALRERKLVKRGTKDKTTGNYSHSLSGTGKKHMETAPAPVPAPAPAPAAALASIPTPTPVPPAPAATPVTPSQPARLAGPDWCRTLGALAPSPVFSPTRRPGRSERSPPSTSLTVSHFTLGWRWRGATGGLPARAPRGLKTLAGGRAASGTQ